MANDADLLREARERYQAGVDADRENRKRDADDRNFYTGGKYQWPAGVPEERQRDGRPCETYNRLPQFVKQVSGEVRQNKPAIKVLPVDGQSDPEIAKIYSAIIRHIESNSDGHRVYAKETEKAVIGGQGWWRILADYCDDEGFDQELKIEGIPNPNAVVCDPDAKQPTRADMTWAFVTEMVSREAFEKKYPDISQSDFDSLDDSARAEWTQGDKIRIAEYWRKSEDGKRKLYALQGPDGQIENHNEDDIRKMLGGATGSVKEMLAGLGIQIKAERDVTIYKIESILLCGAGKLSEWQAWPGKFIPLVRVVGEEVEAGDTVFRHGMIHHAIPPQRSYNFARNAMMERHGASTKSPWLVTAKQIVNYKGMWETANTKNHAVLVYDPDPLAGGPPIRNAPPQLDAAAYQESQIASEDMKATTGIYDAALGAKSNETSGIAIARRDAQGDTATYVYIDNMEAGITHTGRMLVDLIPHYYSNERVIRMIGEDNEVEKFEQINKLMPDGKTWNDISRGKFDVVVTTGPAYATKRQEAAENMLKLAQLEGVAAVGGDIIVRALDLPMGDKLADRMQKMLPPGIDEEVDKKRQEAEQQQGPKEPDPMQMAQQQAMQIDLATKEAEAREAAANAQKAEAEAMKAMAEVQALQSGSDPKIDLMREEIGAKLQLQTEAQAHTMHLAERKQEFEFQQAAQKAALDERLADRRASLDEQVAGRRAEREDFAASSRAEQQNSREG